MTTLVAFAFVLGVLVFVHELGHFLAAKRVGIRVLKFQLGFNPTIISFRHGDTVYGIGALPLGGYVKMAGEAPEDVEVDENITQADELGRRLQVGPGSRAPRRRHRSGMAGPVPGPPDRLLGRRYRHASRRAGSRRTTGAPR